MTERRRTGERFEQHPCCQLPYADGNIDGGNSRTATLADMNCPGETADVLKDSCEVQTDDGKRVIHPSYQSLQTKRREKK